MDRADYWDSYYASADGIRPTHEWFKSFASLKPLFETYLLQRDLKSKILHLGAGDSWVPQELASLGFRNQICVDFSPVVVNIMAAQASQGIEWRQEDVRDLKSIADRSIDFAFDKGTLDAMIHGSPWNPPDEVKANTAAYMTQIQRVLKDDGVFVCVSYRQPHFVKPLVTSAGHWRLTVEVLREGESTFDYHAFILRKDDN